MTAGKPPRSPPLRPSILARSRGNRTPLLARDAGVAVAMAATARGRKNQGETQVAFDQFSGVLNNNPPKLPPPDPSASREETASRAALMKRMQIAQARLKDASADDAAFKAARRNCPA